MECVLERSVECVLAGSTEGGFFNQGTRVEGVSHDFTKCVRKT